MVDQPTVGIGRIVCLRWRVAIVDVVPEEVKYGVKER